MLARLAALAIRAPRRVLGIALALVVIGGVLGAPVSAHLSAGGFADPEAESSRATTLLDETFTAGEPNLVLLVTAPDGVDSAAARATGAELLAGLRTNDEVSQIQSYFAAPAPVARALRSEDGRSAIVAARVAGDDNVAPKRAGEIADQLSGTRDGVTVRAGGLAVGSHQVNEQTVKDLALAEAIAVPITVIVLIWVFGSLVASLLPLAVGLVAIVQTLAILRGLATVTDVSIYSMNLATALGFALAIDYSLLIVSRYREETAAGRGTDEAIRRTMQTAGRTVLFSAVTVALSLSALLVFPQYFLRSFAYAGLAVVGMAALASMIILPALLALLGTRIDGYDLREPVRRALRLPQPRAVPLEQTFWYRVASVVMRRALPIGLGVSALFLVLGAPFLNSNFGLPDDRVLTSSATSHQVGDVVRAEFSQSPTAILTAVVPDAGGVALDGYAAALSRVDGVTVVTSPAGVFAGGRQVAQAPPDLTAGSAAYLTINTGSDPYSDAGVRQLEQLRSVPQPTEVLFTGAAAFNVDVLHALGAKLPLAIGLIALTTFCILFLFTGSIVLPLKALLLNTLSLSATFGAMVWIFQEGHLAGLFGFTPTGYLVASMPILMFCVAFGMSMDYEVFLLARIREAWVASERTSADNTYAVCVGLARTGRIVTAAALLMSIVFFCMTTSKVSFLQMFGLGLTLAVLADATLVRAVLVPALMKLLGKYNWWAPSTLARLHDRFGIHEHIPDEVATTSPALTLDKQT